MGGVPPFGYDLRYQTIEGRFLSVVRYMPDGTKRLVDAEGNFVRTLARGEALNVSKRDRAKLVPSSPERVKALQYIFRMYTEQGKGYKSIAETLNVEEIPTARGPEWSHIYSGRWTDTTIRAILVNPLYAGDMVWNRRTDARFHSIKDGRAVERDRMHAARLVPNDEADWLVVRDAHHALVSRRTFDRARTRRENHPCSIEQRGVNPRLKTNGRTWSGMRSRFVLSGILTCALCGSRYQGVTRRKGKKRIDGTRVTTRFYGCGGHVTKGNKVCQMNPIPQDELEEVVCNAVLEFYAPYLADDGLARLTDQVKEQTGSEREEIGGARERAEAERDRIAGIIDNLLDNITETNREFVDQRLKELTAQRQHLEARLEELDRLTATQAEIQSIVAETLKFLSGLEFTLRRGLPQEKLVALRQCIERIHVDKPKREVKITLRALPAGDLQETQELTVLVSCLDATRIA